MFGHTKEELHEVDLAQMEVEYEEPILVGFFIVQNAKLRKLEVYYNSFYKVL